MSERVHKLSIQGMTCGGCSSRVKRVLEQNPEVVNANVSFESNSGVITTTEKLTAEHLIVIVNNAGFVASE